MPSGLVTGLPRLAQGLGFGSFLLHVSALELLVPKEVTLMGPLGPLFILVPEEGRKGAG